MSEEKQNHRSSVGMDELQAIVNAAVTAALQQANSQAKDHAQDTAQLGQKIAETL